METDPSILIQRIAVKVRATSLVQSPPFPKDELCTFTRLLQPLHEFGHITKDYYKGRVGNEFCLAWDQLAAHFLISLHLIPLRSHNNFNHTNNIPKCHHECYDFSYALSPKHSSSNYVTSINVRPYKKITTVTQPVDDYSSVCCRLRTLSQNNLSPK